MRAVSIFLTSAAILVVVQCQNTDETLKEKAKGSDVVEAVVRKIQRSGIFAYDQNLLRRLAYVESLDGEDSKTYRDTYLGGIWQVDEEIFNRTKNISSLNSIYTSIKTIWSIEWATVKWEDLLKPFHSGLAARLYFHTLAILGKVIPGTVAGQAVYWQENYRTNGSLDNFTSLIKRLESDGGFCEGQLDMCIVLDGSGSIGNKDFILAKSFVADLVGTFSPNSTRVAFVLFSEYAEEIFNFNNKLTPTQMNSTIRNVKYPNSFTNTPAGLAMAVSLFNSTTIRPGVPRLVATFTDGNHNRGNSSWQSTLQSLKNASLTSFSVGIGQDINPDELLQIALNDSSRVFTVNNYDALAEFFYQMNTITCEVPQEPELGQEQNGTLKANEKRYFRYAVPDAGLTLTLSSTGKVGGWWSYTEKTPNSALFDGIISSTTFIPKTALLNEVFITVKSESQDVIEYIVSTKEGNHSGTNSVRSSCTLAIILSFLTSFIVRNV